jgi:hypothetical protein
MTFERKLVNLTPEDVLAIDNVHRWEGKHRSLSSYHYKHGWYSEFRNNSSDMEHVTSKSILSRILAWIGLDGINITRP